MRFGCCLCYLIFIVFVLAFHGNVSYLAEKEAQRSSYSPFSLVASARQTKDRDFAASTLDSSCSTWTPFSRFPVPGRDLLSHFQSQDDLQSCPGGVLGVDETSKPHLPIVGFVASVGKRRKRHDPRDRSHQDMLVVLHDVEFGEWDAEESTPFS